MKSHTEYLTLNVPARMAFVNITRKVEEVVRRERRQGRPVPGERHAHHRHRVHQRRRSRACTRTTSSGSRQLAPSTRAPNHYHHNRTGEDNADAHLKRQVMGREVVVAITNGKLDFGPWEQIFYGEFDGRRPKRVLVKVIGE